MFEKCAIQTRPFAAAETNRTAAEKRIKPPNQTAVLGNTTATLVIDPGHGGIDGGAVSQSGVKESDINLAISDKMACLADFLGVRYVKTVEAQARVLALPNL